MARRRRQRPQRSRAQKVYDQDGKRHRTELHRFHVVKPFCAPARETITSALNPYGIPMFNYGEMPMLQPINSMLEQWKIELRTWENLQYGPAAPGFLPFCIKAWFDVPAGQAGWAEDLMVKTGKLAISKGHVKGRGAEGSWATQNKGSMPTPWDSTRWDYYAKLRQGGASGSEASAQSEPFHRPFEYEEGKACIEPGCKKGHAAWQTAQEMRDAAKSGGKSKESKQQSNVRKVVSSLFKR